MDRREKDLYVKTNPETMIDCVCTKGEKVLVTEMPFTQFVNMKPKDGWSCKCYQKGFHTYKTNINRDGNKGTN